MSQVDGGGFVINSLNGSKDFIWRNALQAILQVTQNIDPELGKSFRINNNNVLTANTLGSGVVNSSFNKCWNIRIFDSKWHSTSSNFKPQER